MIMLHRKKSIKNLIENQSDKNVVLDGGSAL